MTVTPTLARVGRRFGLMAAVLALLALSSQSAADGAQQATGPTVAPTKPPSPYKVPRSAIVVRNGAGLARALDSRRYRNVVLADGVYDLNEPFSNSHGTQVYAQHLGKAVLRAGMVVGGAYGPGGARIQGLVFDVSDPTKTSNNGIIYTWGDGGNNLTVLDSVFRGNNKIDAGLFLFNPLGLDAERDIFVGFTGVGIRASDNVAADYHADVPVIKLIQDIRINGVSRPTPGDSGGRSEAGLWVGEPVKYGVHRIRVRNVSISGIETVNNSWDTTFTDLDIDMSGPNANSGVGVYMEHMSIRNTFTNFKFKGTRLGFNCEWNYGTPGDAASHFSVIRNGVIDAAGWPRGGSTVGVNLDEGTESTTVTNVTFKHQTFAGIAAYKNEGTNHFDGNSFSLARGATPISDGHV